jgi:hypothetical protein
MCEKSSFLRVMFHLEEKGEKMALRVSLRLQNIALTEMSLRWKGNS